MVVGWSVFRAKGVVPWIMALVEEDCVAPRQLRVELRVVSCELSDGLPWCLLNLEMRWKQFQRDSLKPSTTESRRRSVVSRV